MRRPAAAPVGLGFLLCAAAGLAACTSSFAGPAPPPQPAADMQRCAGPANEGVDPWKLDQAIANAKPGTTKTTDFVNFLGRAPKTGTPASGGGSRLIYFAEYRDSAAPDAPSCGAAIAFDFRPDGTYRGWSVVSLADTH